MNQTTFEMKHGNTQEKGVFLSMNGPSILKKKTQAEVISFVVNQVNKDFAKSKLDLEIKFDIDGSHRRALLLCYELDGDYNDLIHLEISHIHDKLVIKPHNMFTTLLIYGFLVNPNVVKNCTVAIVEGYGTFRYFKGRVSFAPESITQEISITTKIQTDEY